MMYEQQQPHLVTAVQSCIAWSMQAREFDDSAKIGETSLLTC